MPSDSLPDADRQGLGSKPPEPMKTTELDGDDLFLMPLGSKRSSRRLRRTSLQLYRQSRENGFTSELAFEEKCSGVNEQDKETRITENCPKDISSEPEVMSVQISGQHDALRSNKNTSHSAHKGARHRKRKNLHSQPHEKKSDDFEIENVIASLAACSSGEESVLNASALPPESSVHLQPIEEDKEQSSAVADTQDVFPAASDSLTKICEEASADLAGMG